MAKTMMVQMTDDSLRAIARIIPGGGAAMALDELLRRREKGEDVHVFHVPASNSIIVGPMPADEVGDGEN